MPYKNSSYLHEAVDSHDGHVRLALGVVHQVEIDQLLELQVIGLHAVNHVWKQRAGRRQTQTLHNQASQHFYSFFFSLGQFPDVISNASSHSPRNLTPAQMQISKTQMYILF